MSTQADELRDTLVAHIIGAEFDPEGELAPSDICAAICDTLGITRGDVGAIRWSATGTRIYEALTTLLEVAGR